MGTSVSAWPNSHFCAFSVRIRNRARRAAFGWLFVAACSSGSAADPESPPPRTDAPSPTDPAASLDGGVRVADATAPSDAEAGDAEPPTSSKCAGTQMTLCDGFEGAAIDTATWSIVLEKNAKVTIDNIHVKRGTSALHVHTGESGVDTAGTIGIVHTTKGFPLA